MEAKQKFERLGNRLAVAVRLKRLWGKKIYASRSFSKQNQFCWFGNESSAHYKRKYPKELKFFKLMACKSFSMNYKIRSAIFGAFISFFVIFFVQRNRNEGPAILNSICMQQWREMVSAARECFKNSIRLSNDIVKHISLITQNCSIKINSSVPHEVIRGDIDPEAKGFVQFREPFIKNCNCNSLTLGVGKIFSLSKTFWKCQERLFSNKKYSSSGFIFK